jgi:hypothetical protein
MRAIRFEFGYSMTAGGFAPSTRVVRSTHSRDVRSTHSRVVRSTHSGVVRSTHSGDGA